MVSRYVILAAVVALAASAQAGSSVTLAGPQAVRALLDQLEQKLEVPPTIHIYQGRTGYWFHTAAIGTRTAGLCRFDSYEFEAEFTGTTVSLENIVVRHFFFFLTEPDGSRVTPEVKDAHSQDAACRGRHVGWSKPFQAKNEAFAGTVANNLQRLAKQTATGTVRFDCDIEASACGRELAQLRIDAIKDIEDCDSFVEGGCFQMSTETRLFRVHTRPVRIGEAPGDNPYDWVKSRSLLETIFIDGGGTSPAKRQEPE